MKKITLTLFSIFFVFLLASLVGNTPAYAVKGAIFPDPLRSQPPIPGVEPNISHNIQDRGVVSPDIPQKQPTAPTAETPASTENSGTNLLWWIIGGVIIAGVITLIVRIQSKKGAGADWTAS